MSPSPGFTDEARENVAALEAGVLALESGAIPDPADAVAPLFRAAHNLKGMAAMEELDELATVAHRMETVLDHHRHSDERPSGATVDVLLAGCDALAALVEAAERGDPPPATGELLGRLDATIAGLGSTDPAADAAARPPPAAAAPPVKGALGRIVVALDEAARLPGARAMVVNRKVAAVADVLATEPPLEELRSGNVRTFALVLGACDEPDAVAAAVTGLPDVASARWEPVTADTPPPHPASEPAAPPPTTSIRVDVDRLDELADAVGELVVDRNRLAGEVERSGDRATTAALRRLNRTLADLQLAVMRVRLVSLEATVERARRLVRDVARDLGKEVVFDVDGEGTEIDRSLVDEMVTPLVHLLRNAVDHGIEPSDARRAAGKPPAGHLALRAYHQGSRVVIEVTDDGAGIDLDRVAAKAVRLGLVAEHDVASLGADQLLDVMFTPGFSTREEVSAVSGRGVGLDVVRSQVTRLGGDIDVQTRPGSGTTFRMRLPLSLAVLDALVVAVGEQQWAIPIDSAVETAHLTHLVGGVGAVPRSARHRGGLVPVIHGAEVLGGEAAPEPPHVAVIFDDLGTRFALTVDDLVGSREVVVKPVPARLAGMDHLSGVTILPDGAVGLIIDLPTLARRWRSANPRPAVATRAPTAEATRSRDNPEWAVPAGLRRAADALSSLTGQPTDIGPPRRGAGAAPSVTTFVVPLVGAVDGEVRFAFSGHEAPLLDQGVEEPWHGEALSEWANMLGSQLAVGLGEALAVDVRVGLPRRVDEIAEGPGDGVQVWLRAGVVQTEVGVVIATATPR